MSATKFHNHTKQQAYVWHMYVTLHNKYTNIPPPSSMNFATLVPRSLGVRLSRSSRFIMRKEAPKMRALLLVYPPSYLNFALPNPTYKYLMELGPEIQTAPSGHPFRIPNICILSFFFSHSPVLSPPKLLTSFPESLCMFVIITNFVWV